MLMLMVVEMMVKGEEELVSLYLFLSYSDVPERF